MSDTLDRVKEILVKEFSINAENLTATTTIADLGVDSLAIIEMFYRFEEVFGISVETEPGDLKTLADVVNYIDTLVATKLADQAGA